MRISHAVYQVVHGSLSFGDLVSGRRGVTGSEQAMLYLAKSQADQGDLVSCYLPTEKPGFDHGVEMLNITSAWPRLRRMDNADVAIAWLSADTLRGLSPNALRVHSLQINDWLMNAPDYEEFVDVFVAVSRTHKKHLQSCIGSPRDDSKWEIIPNGVDYNRFPVGGTHTPFRCAYLSSPDRGLHWLLAMWPEIRFAYPQAELHVFYEVKAWQDAAKGLYNEVGLRADYVRRRGVELERGGGVIFRNAVSPEFLAHELVKADVMLYPCDPYRFTEGFGVAVMEACAAGVVPIITDADAFGEIYEGSGAIIVPRGDDRTWTDQYLEQVLKAFQDRQQLEFRRYEVQQFARQYDWPIVAKQWKDMITRRKG